MVAMLGSTSAGLLLILAAIVVFVLVGLFYMGDRRERPPSGSERGGSRYT
ncbi:hypothetical protein [Actinomadura parmotrematis]|uniref:Uncharacterized protein n=1 Tax=Actinomadura parmotrematis TaxID=2864039 RepID=A0ABS7G4Y2_9ACTN|nr:hypothetical protein [Actinomadura parmotrematis]MBW8487753.1 hypothetical protein [Actinomadura parmotrematis]